MRGELIQLFKIINGYEAINFLNSKNFSRNQSYNLRRNNKCIVIENVKSCMQRYHFLKYRVVNL